MGLNPKQKAAVEYLSGPLLVLAGPGTGKTQLLSEKVAYILENTDTDASNILCLTFTDMAALNMRERLKSIVGKDALKVNIGTYHSFGQEIIMQYKNYSPDYSRNIESAIDDVTKYKIIKEIQSNLPVRDILRGDRIKDIIETISQAKSAGLTADDLAKIAKQNQEDSEVLSKALSPLLMEVVPRKFRPSLENAYLPIRDILQKYENLPPIVGNIERLITTMARDIKEAVDEAVSTDKLGPLSNFKKAYFENDDKGNYRLTDRVANLKLASVAVVMREYQKYLEDNHLCDFDDMIIEAVKILTEDKGFQQTLEEKYQFIMLDEFQDTNPMQLTIVKKLTDYEKPMIMAVGDDDQAIYEFQGATPTNFSDFQAYYNAETITLTENYRSTQEVLDFSKQVIDQLATNTRYGGEKPLTAHCPDPKKSEIFRMEFLSSDQEYVFVASKIAELVKKGVSQKEIAIISRRNKYFMPLLPYLKDYPEIKIAYEKRDNLFEDEKIHQILTILRLIDEVSSEKKPTVSMLEVLSYSWLEVPIIELIKLVAEARDAHKATFEYLLTANCSEKMQDAMDFLADLIKKAFTEPLEVVLNSIASKMRVDILESFEVFRFYENLAALRAKLIKHVGEKPLRVKDLIEMVDDYEAAAMPLSVASPYRDADDAVQVMSAHKAKGLEFEYVFILSADNADWGKGGRNNNLLVLPKNLIQIRHTGITDGECLRILYVALTRAKQTLFITNSLHDFAGKSPARLEYLNEYTEKTETGAKQVISPFLPSRNVLLGYEDADDAEEVDDRALLLAASKRSVDSLKNYLTPFVKSEPDMQAIYQERIKGYKMSPTSLTSFIDIIHAGPEQFFERQVLKNQLEPENESRALGNLVHAAFEQVTNSGISDEAAIEYYLSELEKKDLPLEAKARIREKGPADLAVALEAFSEILRTGKAEVNLDFEHLAIEGIPVTGKIDHLVIDEENQTIEIYDFKTGKYDDHKWTATPALFKDMLQLCFYKLLLNNSPTYQKYKIERAHILFVIPDNEGKVHDRDYEFNTEDEQMLLDLMQAVYYQIFDLKFLNDKEVMIPANRNFKIKDIRTFIELLLAKFEER